MPRREPSAYVWDVRYACQELAGILAGVDREKYLAETMIRYAVERILIMIGAAIIFAGTFYSIRRESMGRLALPQES